MLRRVHTHAACTLALASAMCTAVLPIGEAVDDFVYVLQPAAISTSALTDAAFHWLILEPTRDGGASGDFAASEITQIGEDGPCPKTILAYLSIGEAEDYRDYWDSGWVDGDGNPIPGVAPDWLGPTNPDWPGNYKVRYWDPDWQALLFGTPGVTPLDRIVAQGFDGVYLDIIDAYDFWSSAAGGFELSRVDARTRMIDLVEAIGDYADTARAGGFLVFPQGGADIIRDDNDSLDGESDRYFAAVDGIGREDVFYNELAPQLPAETDYTLAQLREYGGRGKTVLLTDYAIDGGNPDAATNDARVSDFHARTRGEGFIPYAAYNDRELNAIVTFGGGDWSVSQPEPGCLIGLPVPAASSSAMGMAVILTISCGVALFRRRRAS